jgi:hypothetical protein
MCEKGSFPFEGEPFSLFLYAAKVAFYFYSAKKKERK